MLFELLSGRRAFAGEDVSDTLAAVLRADPDWSKLPRTPNPIRDCCAGACRRIVANGSRISLTPGSRSRTHCAIPPKKSLATAPRRASPAGASACRWLLPPRRSLPSAVAWTMRTGSAEPADLVQLQLFPPGDVTIAPGTVPEISPDGRAIAFAGFGADGISRVFVRVLDSPEYGRWPAPRESETG